jgi:hypothetical protein
MILFNLRRIRFGIKWRLGSNGRNNGGEITTYVANAYPPSKKG